RRPLRPGWRATSHRSEGGCARTTASSAAAHIFPFGTILATGGNASRAASGTVFQCSFGAQPKGWVPGPSPGSATTTRPAMPNSSCGLRRRSRCEHGGSGQVCQGERLRGAVRHALLHVLLHGGSSPVIISKNAACVIV